MIKSKRFFFSVLIVCLIFLLVTIALYLADLLTYPQFISILIAFGISSLNFIAGLSSAKISLGKGEKAFIRIVFGSMVTRLFLTLLIVLIVLVFLDINRNSFIFSIFIFYIFYLVVEVFYLNFIKN